MIFVWRLDIDDWTACLDFHCLFTTFILFDAFPGLVHVQNTKHSRLVICSRPHYCLILRSFPPSLVLTCLTYMYNMPDQSAAMIVTRFNARSS